MTPDPLRLKRRAPALPLVHLGERPERVEFRAGARFRMPAHKERDLAEDPRRP